MTEEEMEELLEEWLSELEERINDTQKFTAAQSKIMWGDVESKARMWMNSL